MKRLILILLFALVTISAQAQAQDNSFEKESQKAIDEQKQANLDIVNGAQRFLSSKNSADILHGLTILQGYLERIESKYNNQDLKSCTMSNSWIRWNDTPCNPIPHLKRNIELEFNRRDWPVANSPSAAYTWLIDQYTNGSSTQKEKAKNFAETNAYKILEYGLLAQVEQLKIHHRIEKANQDYLEQREKKLEENSSFTGNFASIGDRFISSVKEFFSSILAVFVIIVVMTLLPLPLTLAAREKVIRALFLMLITTIPFFVLYIFFGGWFDMFSKNYIHGPLRFLLIIAVFVPACVLMSRILKGYSLHLPSFKSSPSNGNDLHGSAQWSDTQTGIQAGKYIPTGHVLTDSHGFTLGRAPEESTSKALNGFDPRLRYMGHVLTIAPNGSGKGIGSVIPTLLDYPGSTVVLDIKGENYAVTSRFRREQLGHNVILLDPFGVTGQPSHSFNWLDRLNPDDPDVVAESATLAEMMVISEGQASDSSAHFNESAKSLIRGLMVYVATLPEDRRNMGEARRLLTLSAPDFDKVLAEMMVSKRGFELMARSANTFSDAPQKERGSILSTARRHLAFLDDPRISAALSRSDFSLDDLKTTPMTVYLVMPPSRLAANRAFVRAFFGQSINTVMASAGKPQYRVLFLLDEFPQLGRMDIVEEKLPLIRGYGGAFWLVAQNLAQLKETYPKWQNFVANCGAKQYFGISDVETARYISESLGKKTVEFYSKGSNSNVGQSFSTGSSESQQFTGRELLTADEITRLPREKEIVLIAGETPYFLDRLNYLTDGEYAGLFDPNPYE